MKFSRRIEDQPLHDVDSKVPGLNLLVNDRKRLHSSKSEKVHLPPRVVAELELNSVIPPPDTIKEVQKEIANHNFKSLNHITQQTCDDNGRAPKASIHKETA